MLGFSINKERIERPSNLLHVCLPRAKARREILIIARPARLATCSSKTKKKYPNNPTNNLL